jgi:hypothetical protein
MIHQMPSPFPGMDPYLEGPEWRSVHTHLANEIARYLSDRLPDNYIARAEKVYLLTDSDDDLPRTGGRSPSWRPLPRRVPDVGVVALADPSAGTVASAAATIEPPLQLVLALDEPEPIMTVEVLDLSDRSLVTAIEVLSATNKAGDGRAEYLAKRRRMLARDSHLIELDLLRSGKRVPMADPLPDTPYFALVSRVERRPTADVWPISLRQPLPTIPVPLRLGDADVPLDLQAVLTTLYDVFRYGRELDYTRPPAVPLQADDAAWAAGLLAGRVR